MVCVFAPETSVLLALSPSLPPPSISHTLSMRVRVRAGLTQNVVFARKVDGVTLELRISHRSWARVGYNWLHLRLMLVQIAQVLPSICYPCFFDISESTLYPHRINILSTVYQHFIIFGGHPGPCHCTGVQVNAMFAAYRQEPSQRIVVLLFAEHVYNRLAGVGD
jgi:hypothetical protein